jgi:hypothetical protein
MIDGIGSQPFSAQTLPPLSRPHVSCKAMVLASSRKLYAKDRTEVEGIVAALHTPTKADTPKKRTDDARSAGAKESRPVAPLAASQPLPRAVSGTASAHKTAARSIPTPRVVTERASRTLPPVPNTEAPDAASQPGSAPIHAHASPADTSLAELRAVLASISNAEKKTVTSASEPSTELPKPNQLEPGANRVKKPDQRQHSVIPVRNTENPTSPSTQKTTPSNDVRSALAAALKDVMGPPLPPEELVSTPSVHDAPPRMSQQTVVTPVFDDVSPPMSSDDIEPSAAPSISDAQALAAEADALMAELETTFTQLPSHSASPSVRDVKRLLKPSGNDRNPFTASP